MTNEILIRNGYLQVPPLSKLVTSPRFLGTVISNLVYYGFVPDKAANHHLLCCGDKALGEWYSQIEPVLKKVTGADKKMEKFVVYKNFPAEVLDMKQGEYWFRQIFIYLGVPQHFLAQDEAERPFAFENLPLKVLRPQVHGSLQEILGGLLSMGNRWTVEQKSWVNHLLFNEEVSGDVAAIPFKENLVDVLALYHIKGKKVDAKISPMDVLRFAAVLSGASADLKTKFKFKNFKRAERRFLGSLLEVHGWEKLAENFAADKELWKRLLERIHPKDFNFVEIHAAYDLLYNKQCHSNASWIEYYIQNKDVAVFQQLRAGEFMRRLKHLYSVFGVRAFNEFGKRLGELTNLQLLKVNRQLEWHNYHNTRMFAPKGNWARVQIADNLQTINQKDILALCAKIAEELSNRLKDLGPVELDAYADYVKLQTNDSDLLPYGRGTVFPIPDNITFLRSASYWQASRHCWMDNGWNFFDENWVGKGACSWLDRPHGGGEKIAVFSGDPMNSGEMKGRAGQMIDLYLDKMEAAGVRYAVWSILSYNRIDFDDIEDIYVALQMGENPFANKLFEPSRAVINAPLTGKTKTKFAILLDVKKRQLVYLDANFKGSVSNAGANSKMLIKVMPAYQEYLDRLPSVADLFINAKSAGPRTKNFTYVGYNDDNVTLEGQNAYVFKQTNENNSFVRLDINKILNSK